MDEKMKKWNEISKGKKIISIILFLLIIGLFIYGTIDLLKEENWQTTITCGDKVYNITGKDVDEGILDELCPNRKRIIIPTYMEQNYLNISID